MEKMDKRLIVVDKLVNYVEDLPVLENELKVYEWDYDGPCVWLTRFHIIRVLHRFLEKEIQALDVEQWANLIECREDIEFEPTAEQLISDVVHDLANPVLQGKLNPAFAEQMLSRLGPAGP